MNRILRLIPAILFVSLPLAAGCGGPDYPKTVEVSGVVTLDGKPVPNAVVTFMPTNGERSGTGYTDEEGYYTLSTYEEGDGAVPGTHNVAIYPKDPPPMPGGSVGMGKGSAPAPSPQSYTPPFPPRYGIPDKSGFTVEVTVDGENTFPLKMTSQMPAGG